MLIEFENNKNDIDIVEHIIRETSSFDDEITVQNKTPHLQALLNLYNYKEENSIQWLINYYDANGTFLGLDNGNTWGDDLTQIKPHPLTIPLDIPEGTEKVKVTLHMDKSSSKRGFYTWAGKIVTFLIIMLLSSWLLTSLGLIKPF